MPIYTDGRHLMTSSRDLRELHRFARRLGLRRAYFQNHRRHPHYDITSPRIAQKSIELGARQTTTKEMLRRCRAT